jgi:hypothetical protein
LHDQHAGLISYETDLPSFATFETFVTFVKMRILALVLLLVSTPLIAAAQSPDSAAFVTRLGHDTLVLERYVRTGDRVRAEALIRSPSTILRRYDLQLNAAGGIRRFESADIDIASNRVTSREIVVVVGDTAVRLVSNNDSTRETRFRIPPNALPFLNLVQWPNDFVIRRVGASVRDSVVVPYLSGSNATSFVITRLHADSIAIRHPLRGVTRVHVDASNRLLHLDGGATTLKLDVARTNWLPLETMAPAIAARDASRPRAELSPRGDTRATVDGANVSVDYGRPMKRGREIFGKVVPFGQLWRTGANTATQFKTDRDLVVGGTTLPAGQYSIFSIPDAREWTIIINAETNQPGTAHKTDRDVMRVPARVRSLNETVEQFTIAVTDEGDGGTIRFQWDRTEAVLPFKVK